MRPQKAQLKTTTWKWTTGSGTWKKTPFVQVGYKNFDVMVVGGAGGRSGRAGGAGAGPEGDSSTRYAYPAGGGGGASRRFTGLLSNLAPVTYYGVGAKGTNGGNSGISSNIPTHGGFFEDVKWAGNGTPGGLSYFTSDALDVSAEGGEGGEGGEVSGVVHRVTGAVGGTGGGTTALGTGIWDDVAKIGDGGHGGRGAITGGVAEGNGSDGAGVGAGDIYRATGESTQPDNYGGTGGGANIAPIKGGAAELYGTGSGASGNGVVYLKVY